MNLRKALRTAPLGGGIVGPPHTHGAPGLDSWKAQRATGNAHAADRESLRYACVWKAARVLFWRSKLAYERSRHIRRSMASVAEWLAGRFWRFGDSGKR